MPIYEYICAKCSHKFELLRPQSQANENACCPCCRNSARRVFSSFASFCKSSEGTSTRIGGSSACTACSATSCATCQM